MKILLINLNRHEDRLSFFSEQAAALGITFERLTACDENDLSTSFKDSFRAMRPLSHWSRGAIGCFISHQKALSVIAESDSEFGIVFEDDVHLAAPIKPLLSNLGWIPSAADVVRIETTLASVRLGPLHSAGDQFGVAPLLSEAWGAGGYIIRRSAAQLMLAAPPRLHCVADAFLFQPLPGRLATVLNRYQLFPAVCIQDKSRQKAQRVGLSGAIEHLPENFDHGTLSRAFKQIVRSLKGRTAIEIAENNKL